MPPRKIFQFKITLKDIKPPIWRRIQLPATCTFWELHVAIQDAMGWVDCHLHEFRVRDLNGGQLLFGYPDDEFGSDTLPGWRHRVAKFISLAMPSFEYVYDFGDDWRHKVQLEEVVKGEPGITYPRCIKGKRNSPPEDCGGPWGYHDLLAILSDPENEEYEAMKAWADSMKDGRFDPEAFDPASVHFHDPGERLERAYLFEER